uniref:Uncharacterized protein n=1 Tax=Neobodo designis TaxID=312471 RepID=A0A7S1Q723_NEODS
MPSQHEEAVNPNPRHRFGTPSDPNVGRPKPDAPAAGTTQVQSVEHGRGPNTAAPEPSMRRAPPWRATNILPLTEPRANRFIPEPAQGKWSRQSSNPPYFLAPAAVLPKRDAVDWATEAS